MIPPSSPCVPCLPSRIGCDPLSRSAAKASPIASALRLEIVAQSVSKIPQRPLLGDHTERLRGLTNQIRTRSKFLRLRQTEMRGNRPALFDAPLDDLTVGFESFVLPD